MSNPRERPKEGGAESRVPAEWTPHDGGERPVSGEVRVNVRFANGIENLWPLRASFWDWGIKGQYDYAIIAYRRAQPQENEDDAS